MSWSDRVLDELLDGLGYQDEAPDPRAMLRTILELLNPKEAQALVNKLVKRHKKMPHGFIMGMVESEVEKGESITNAQEIVDRYLNKSSGYTKDLLNRVGDEYPQWVKFKEDNKKR